MCNPKVTETGVTIPSNQNVSLDIRNISMRANTQAVSYHLPERWNRVKYLARGDMRGHRKPLQAVVDVVSAVPLSILMDPY